MWLHEEYGTTIWVIVEAPAVLEILVYHTLQHHFNRSWGEYDVSIPWPVQEPRRTLEKRGRLSENAAIPS